jgi:hypothetical protein
MATKRSIELSPESIARADRQRLALEEGARAMADVERNAVAIRKNMERLRALRKAREAEEAEEAKSQSAEPAIPKKKRKKRLAE